ncbi:MAG: DUF4332 domain-containing protein [Pseudomonadota bacterium]
MRYNIEKVEGIAKITGDKLRGCGINRTDQLLERCASKKGRKEVAAASGIEEKLILKWTNFCDLMRVKGIGEQYSELLEAAGVDTVKELRNRKPENLHAAMLEANTKKKMVRQAPGLKQVQGWVAHAKELDPMMTY